MSIVERDEKNKMLREILYDHYSKIDNHRSAKVFESEDTVFFNPSSFTSCKRQIYLKKRNIAPSNPIDAASYIKMDFGSILHSRIQAIVQKMGILIEAERLKVKEFEGLSFRYKVDGIIVLNGQRHIMEIKTTYSHGLYAVLDEPKFADTIQMVLYMLFEHVSRGILIYIGRDTGFIEEHLVSKGDYLYNNAIHAVHEKIEELKILEKQIKNNSIPDKDYQIVLKNKNGMISEKFQKDKVAFKTPWQCSYCAYKDMCWKYELDEIQKHAFYINGEFIN